VDEIPPLEEPGLDAERHQLLAEVASRYYEADQTQSEIAEQLGISRSGVSRLLSEAREMGVVSVSIRWPSGSTNDLSAQIKAYFNINEVYIVPAADRGYPQIVEALGFVAARVLETKLEDHSIIGIAWNTGVYQVVRAFRAARRLGVKVIQLTGTVGAVNPVLDGPDLARWLAQMLGGQYFYLPAPLIVESESTRNALLSDRLIADRLDLARQADIALVGIGTVFPPLCSLLQAGYIAEEELAEIAAQGGVGDILTTFFDIQGAILPLPIHRRIIGLPLDHLRDIHQVIGVAAGVEKAPAIVGALRGKFIDCLVIDDQAARAILQLIRDTPGSDFPV
jgi:DNA-binding transcriptional regulator LsrR (DeoR family)